MAWIFDLKDDDNNSKKPLKSKYKTNELCNLLKLKNTKYNLYNILKNIPNEYKKYNIYNEFIIDIEGINYYINNSNKKKIININ